MKTTYSRRELYALGEPFGDSATEQKLGGGYVCGGGGGGLLGAIVAVVAIVATGGAAAVVEAGAEAGAAAIAEGTTAAAAAETTAAAAETATATSSITAESLGSFEGIPAGEAAAANSFNTDQLLSQMGKGFVRGAVQSGLKDVLTGKTDNLGQDLFFGGLAGGAGAGAGNFATQEFGANQLVSGAVQGGVGAGTGAALNGSSDVTGAIEKGLISGGAGGATNMISQDQQLGPLASGALKGAVQGGTGALLNKGDVATGILAGGAGGAAGSAVGNETTQATGSKLLGSVLGGTAGSLASAEAAKMLGGAPTIPGQQMPMRSIQASGQPMGNVASGMPTAGNYGNPTAGLTRSNLGGQTGIPNQASTSGGTSFESLAGNNAGAGILSGTNPVMNTGTASNAAPSSGLNASGLPAPLTPGVLTSQAPTSSEQAAKVAQMTQLYPQLAHVDPRIINSLVSNAPAETQTYKRGGAVHMAAGGHVDLAERLKQIESRGRIEDAMSMMSAAQKHLTPQNQHLASVPFGDPSGNYNRPVSPGYFMTRMKEGGDIHGLDYGDGETPEHHPQFITGATGHYVKGKGDGQSDDIPAMLADGEYVFDADTVASLGNGSSDAGAKLLDHFREALREHKRSAPAHKIPPQASPLAYMKEALKRHKG